MSDTNVATVMRWRQMKRWGVGCPVCECILLDDSPLNACTRMARHWRSWCGRESGQRLTVRMHRG